MRSCSCPPRYSCSKYLRAQAVVESRALRLLLRAHGFYPVVNRAPA